MFILSTDIPKIVSLTFDIINLYFYLYLFRCVHYVDLSIDLIDFFFTIFLF